MPPPGQRCGTVCLNSFGNRTSPSDNSNELCLVSWAAAPRTLTRNLLTYLLTYTPEPNIRVQLFIEYVKQYAICVWHFTPVLQSSTTTVNTARNLGVMLNSQLTMSAQVGAACRSAYNYLRQLRPVVRALSVEARKTVVHAMVSSCLDYCNSLLIGVTDSLVQRLQAVQNAPHVSSVALADPSTSRQY